jgi:hypothetical protein
MHSGPFLTRAVIECVKQNIPGVFELINARRKKAVEFPGVYFKHLRDDITKHTMYQHESGSGKRLEIAVKSSTPFFQEDSMTYFFGNKGENEKQIKVEFLDVPNLHCLCEEGIDFISALVEAN